MLDEEISCESYLRWLSNNRNKLFSYICDCILCLQNIVSFFTSLNHVTLIVLFQWKNFYTHNVEIDGLLYILYCIYNLCNLLPNLSCRPSFVFYF